MLQNESMLKNIFKEVFDYEKTIVAISVVSIMSRIWIVYNYFIKDITSLGGNNNG